MANNLYNQAAEICRLHEGTWNAKKALLNAIIQDVIRCAQENGQDPDKLTIGPEINNYVGLTFDEMAATGYYFIPVITKEPEEDGMFYGVSSFIKADPQTEQVGLASKYVRINSRTGVAEMKINGEWTDLFAYEDGLEVKDCRYCNKNRECALYIQKRIHNEALRTQNEMAMAHDTAGQEANGFTDKMNEKISGSPYLTNIFQNAPYGESELAYAAMEINEDCDDEYVKDILKEHKLLCMLLTRLHIIDEDAAASISFAENDEIGYFLTQCDDIHLGFAVTQEGKKLVFCQYYDPYAEEEGYNGTELLIPVYKTSNISDAANKLRSLLRDPETDIEQTYTIPVSERTNVEIPGLFLMKKQHADLLLKELYLDKAADPAEAEYIENIRKLVRENPSGICPDPERF